MVKIATVTMIIIMRYTRKMTQVKMKIRKTKKTDSGKENEEGIVNDNDYSQGTGDKGIVTKGNTKEK